MRNLKKLLAVIVAICLVATLSVPAFAADAAPVYGTQAQTLHDLGLYAGITSGTFTPDLGTALDRQTGVVLLLRVFGLEKTALAMSDADVTKALTGFTDAKTLPDWSKKQMAYAIANGLVKGMTTTTIGPKDALNGKMYASLILRELGYTDAAYDTATTTLADKGGLTADQATAFATKTMSKDDLVGMTYGALAAKDTAGNTVIANLVKGGVVTADAAAKAGLYNATVTATAAATGAKIITVTFNQAVNSAKATFVVKRDTTTLNVTSAVFAADNKSVTLNMAGKLLAGDYTVTVKGLTATDLTLTIAGVKDEAASKIVLNGTTAAAIKDTTGFVTGAAIGYKVLNQYGEDITTASTTLPIKWTSTLGTADDNNGSGTVTLSNVPNTTLVGQTFVLTGVLTDTDNGNAIVVTQNMTIGNPASLDSITFDSVYNSDGNKLATDSTYSDFALVISSAKDQYGNDMTAAQLNEDLVPSISNPSVIAFNGNTNAANGAINYITNNNGATNDKLGIVFAEPSNKIDGTATIRLISKSTGKTFSFDVTVAKQSRVDSIKIQTPANVVATGETVDIPFTAVDQNGATVTDFAELSNDVQLTPNYVDGSGNPADKTVDPVMSHGNLYWAHDYVNGVAVLKFQAPATGHDGSIVTMAMVKSDGKYSQLTINVKTVASPAYVASLTSDVSANLAKGATTTIQNSYVNINDNYDRSFSLTDNSKLGTAAGQYRIAVKQDSATDTVTTLTSGSAIVANVHYISGTGTSDVVNITGNKKGTSTIDISLEQNTGTTATPVWTPVEGSQYQLKEGVVEKTDIKSYTVDALGTIFDVAAVPAKVPTGLTAADYAKDVNVYGVKADGTKVKMATTDYSVTTDNNNLTYDTTVPGKLSAQNAIASGDSDTTCTVIVTVDADGAPQVITAPVVVSVAAPKAASITLDSGAGAYQAAGLASIVKASASTALTNTNVLNLIQSGLVNVTDQYGVRIPNNLITKYYATTYSTGSSLAGLGYGDTFNVTVVYSGMSLTFKVAVVAP